MGEHERLAKVYERLRVIEGNCGCDHESGNVCANCERIQDLLAELEAALEPQPGAESPGEVCVCAAIRFSDGLIVRGHRHTDALRAAHGMGRLPREAEQGFYTTRERFVTREEGAALQNAAGRVSADYGGPIGRLLFSEDLYMLPRPAGGE